MNLLSLAALACLSAGEEARHWKTIPVLDADGIVVRLKVLGRASLATPDWMAVEIDNLGKPPRKVKTVTFRMSSAAEELATGKALFTGSLASGQLFDPTGAKIFTDGRYRNVRSASDYSAALLGLPGKRPPATPADGYRVQARIHVRIDYDGGVVVTPAEGVPFDFEWRQPTQAGFAAMRARLRDLLANPVNRGYHAAMLSTLLRIPEVTRGLTASDLLAALDRRKGSFDGRQNIVSRLMSAHAGDPAIVRYYQKRLDAGDPAALGDLARIDLWDAGFVGPVLAAFVKNTDEYSNAAKVLDRRWDRTFVPRLVELVTTDPEKHGGALPLLARHRADWQADWKTVKALSEAVSKGRPVVEKNSRDIPDEELEAWAAAVRFWALTGDPEVVRKLTPALADRRRFKDPQPATAFGGLGLMTTHEPERACDAAMDAIWVALDGPDAAQRRLGLTVPRGELIPNDAVLAWRDVQILALTMHLAARRIVPVP